MSAALPTDDMPDVAQLRGTLNGTEVAEYICDMLQSLRGIARGQQLVVLARLIDLAGQEAEAIARGRVNSG